jgi:MYXO-CTERM domain-containing protein
MTDGFPFTNVDVAYLASIEHDLDVAMRNATQKAGFTYVSTLADSATHSACAPTSSAYINGITVRSAGNATEVVPGGLHPNASGAAFLANSVIPEIRDAFPKQTVTPTPRPSPVTESPALRWTIGLVGLLALLAVAALAFVRLRRRTRGDS